MQHLLLIVAIFILLVILFIVIFLIIREVLQRTSHRRRRCHQVGFRVIRNQAEFDEFRRGLYVPRVPIVHPAPDSGIDEVDTSPSSGEVYHWSASSAGSSILTPPTRGLPLDVSRGTPHDLSRRYKAVSFADSMNFSQIDYDESGRVPHISGVSRSRDQTTPKLMSYSSGGQKFTQIPTPKKTKNENRPDPSAHVQEVVMREFQMIEEQTEETELSFEPITSL